MLIRVSALRKLFRLIKGNHQKVLFTAVVISVLTVMASSGLMAFSAFIISFSALQPSIADILVPVTAVRFFGLSRALLRYLERIISHNTIFLYLSNLRVKIYEGVSCMSGEQLFRMGKTDMLNVMTSDIETIQDVFLRGLLPLFSTLLLYLAILGALVFIDLKMAIVFAILYPIATFGMAVVARRLTEGKSKIQIKELGDYKVKLIAFTDEIFELNWNRRTKEYESKLEVSAKRLEKATEKISIGKITATQMQQMIININVFCALLIGIFLVKTSEISGVYLAVCTLVIFTFYESAPAFLTLNQKLEAGDYSANRLLMPMATKAMASNVSSLNNSKAPEISYHEMSFQYEGSNVQLSSIDILLKPNIKMAIVGPSGSGKSTVGALLCGLLAPQEGRIEVDGHAILPDENEALMSYFSMVNQEVYLFHQRLIDNLRIANSDVTKEEIENAIEFAGLSEWIDSGWLASNPWIGEDGMSLSGGQRQRLGLARALLRSAPYLILDEAFAGLDIATETEILNRLLTLEDRGLIWITHRLVQMEKMDVIMVMAHGEIIATGTHDYLVRNCPEYREAL